MAGNFFLAHSATHQNEIRVVDCIEEKSLHTLKVNNMRPKTVFHYVYPKKG